MIIHLDLETTLKNDGFIIQKPEITNSEPLGFDLEYVVFASKESKPFAFYTGYFLEDSFKGMLDTIAKSFSAFKEYMNLNHGISECYLVVPSDIYVFELTNLSMQEKIIQHQINMLVFSSFAREIETWVRV